MYSSKTELVDPDEEHTIETLSVTSTETNDADINIQPVHISTTEGGLSEPQTLMSFIRSNIGTGMLSMPVILRYCGLWTGLSVIFIAGFISTYLMNVLVRTSASVCQRHQLERSKMDYTDTVFYVFKYGPESLRKSKGKMKHTVNVFLLITQIGSLCVYTLFLTENIRYFVGAFAPNLALNFYLVGFIVAAILVPMCLCENMRALALLSVVANVATLFGTILIFAYLFTSGLRPYTSFDAYTNVKDTLIGFCIAMSALEGIGLVLPIQSRMSHPESYAKLTGVLNLGMIIIICANASLAFFGFLKFGENAEGSITLNIPDRQYWFAPIKPLFIIAIVVSYLVQYYIPAAIFTRLMEKLRFHRTASTKRRSVHLTAMRILLVLFTYLVVITIPKLELMISLIGSFSSSLLALVMPPALEIVHLWPDRHSIRLFWLTVVAKHCIFITVGLITFVGGTTATVTQLILEFRPPSVAPSSV